MTAVFVDLPTLAEEYEALSAVSIPLTRERLASAREVLASALARGARADRLLTKADAALGLAEPGSDFDFLVRDLLVLQRELFTIQVHLTSSAQLLMRTNIGLTAAATLAACTPGEDTE